MQSLAAAEGIYTMRDLAEYGVNEIGLATGHRRTDRDNGPERDERLDPETVVDFARRHGRERWRLSPMEYRVWATRYEIETGPRELPRYSREIPVGRTDDERTLISGIVYLAQCRDGWATDNALPLERRFLSAWTGLPEHRVRKAMRALKSRGVIFLTGFTAGLVRTGLYLLHGMLRLVPQSITYLNSATTLVLGQSPLGGKPRLSFEEAVDRLEKVRWRGAQAYACCPAHEDHNPSLSIREADVPGIGFVVYCHAGCDWPDVLAAIHEAGDRA
jgi:hypothetical protein